ncbi:hypothetical protein N7466_011065 [Penicillium verhagenii]|uniref:uncharacterized protein n=1 Tax=Penicillium verhagenii TaxID=1562060 RepID=UPI0025456512|nr:uncharacterized protein N7466_011065 [Penicillium verhagenii]KAJ5917511.1 hypothetical protein N7466_011065 [Penicillium verhagenii]
MDKQDRPCKCHEPGSNKDQGFTYSVGIVRHQRKVHKKNTDAKKPLMCPYADCKRGTGNGSTRQENLRAHLRRCHMHTDDNGRGLMVEGIRANLFPATGMKRRLDSPNEEQQLPEEESGDLHNEVKRLRREVQEKNRRLEELDRIVAGSQ